MPAHYGGFVSIGIGTVPQTCDKLWECVELPAHDPPLTGISSHLWCSDIPATPARNPPLTKGDLRRWRTSPPRLRRGFANEDNRVAIKQACCDSVVFICGERGIRTPGTVIPYVSLANWWFQPLTHLTRVPGRPLGSNGTAKIQ